MYVWEGRAIAQITAADVGLVSPILILVAVIGAALTSVVVLPIYVRR